MRKPPQLHRSRRTLDLHARAGPAQSEPAPSHKPPWFTPHAAAFAWPLAAGAWLLAVAAWLFHRLAFLHNTGGFFAVTRLGVPTNHIMVRGRKHLYAPLGCTWPSSDCAACPAPRPRIVQLAYRTVGQDLGERNCNQDHMAAALRDALMPLRCCLGAGCAGV